MNQYFYFILLNLLLDECMKVFFWKDMYVSYEYFLKYFLHDFLFLFPFHSSSFMNAIFSTKSIRTLILVLDISPGIFFISFVYLFLFFFPPSW